MTINRDLVGRVYESTEPYEVTRGKIREFAEAISDPNPVFRDTAAAKEAGYPDVIAPPTFPIVMGMQGTGQIFVDPAVNLEFSGVLHSEQRFRYTRPVQAGDVVTTTTTISAIKTIGRHEAMTLESEISTVQGEHLVTATSTLLVRGSAEQDAKK
ncbi:MaoC family dehydratase N-terminal domain-containing protein [Salinactinospora qingdaonensis]|uniref:UPF0336 protein GCM10022402_34660 n=1 Tax=Salinactinospora qingdaonensis TaxID=702744 RepID=A0ABP7G278_9ACTN